ncbi:hypothetical protein [Lysobacter sp. TAB13]|uniref:hypothetical protein n=1 Tax=Lysobacter sp. TAB13 TaxID=3233065 RepID=UPI003F981208
MLARLRLERELGAVNWAAPGLPADALLCVRRLVARAPAASGFADRVQSALHAHGSSARRPWLDPGAADAEAVWFDHGELAACLARDDLHGRIGRHWWWRGLLAGRDASGWLREQVFDCGESVVSLIVLLAQRGEAVTWLARVSDADAGRALTALLRDYAVPAGSAADAADAGHEASPHVFGSENAELSVDVPDDPVVPLAVTKQPPSHRDSSPTTPAAVQAAVVRLLAIVPELRSATLGPPALRLLSYALTAHRAPSRLRSGETARALEAWIVRKATSAGAFSPASDSRPVLKPQLPERPQTNSRVDPPTDIGEIRAAVEKRSIVPTPESVKAPIDASEPAHLSGAIYPADLSDPESKPIAKTFVITPAKRTSRNAIRDDVSHVGSEDSPPTRSEAKQAEPATAEIATETDESSQANESAPAPTQIPYASNETLIDTDFGGLFYLLNVALALELYGDFTAPRARNLALDPWDWLALLGEHWFGEEYLRDPLHGLLADCAGRAPRRRPGAGFDPPRDWRIDPDWLEPWGEAEHIGYRAGHGRLRIHHPAGFVLFDLPRDPALTPRAQATALCAGYPQLSNATLAIASIANAPARGRRQRWLLYLAAYLQQRLARALGIDAASPHLPDLVCRHRARVRRGPTSIDVHLSLADLPLALRCAGLDRDPGWIPAAGHGIRFHFAAAQAGDRA